MKGIRFVVPSSCLFLLACGSTPPPPATPPSADTPPAPAEPAPTPAPETPAPAASASAAAQAAPPAPAELTGDALVAALLDGKPAWCAKGDRVAYIEVTAKPGGDAHTLELVKANGTREATVPACTADKSGSCTPTDAAKKTMATRLGSDPCKVIGELGKPLDAEVALPEGKRRLSWKTDAVWVEGDGQPATKVKALPVDKGAKASPSAWWALPGSTFVVVRIIQEPEGKPLTGKTYVVTLPAAKP